ncbi:MAG: sulfatase/phosphatase domain-containing protein, partial [Bacteroidota bacterium]
QTVKDRIKGHVYEGGIRVPMIVHWPSTVAPGTTSDHLSAFQDVLPTLAEVTGATTKDNLDGISFLPTLKGEEQPKHEYLYWEFPAYRGQQAIRKGKWKAIRKHMQDGNLDLELYDLSQDIQEANDVAKAHPEVVAKMELILNKEHVPSPIDRFRFAVLGEKK